MKTDEELIASAMPGEGDFIEFDGMNCDDYADQDDPPCAGWDGKSKRCECGNRRVSWIVEDGVARGEAY